MVDQKFRKSPEEIVTYSYIDLLRNLGYIKFYPATASNGSYIVVDDPTFISETSDTNLDNQNLGANYVDALTLTFDLQFNVPKDILGDAFFNIPFYNQDPNSNTEVKIKVEMYHYDGVTETELGNSTSIEYLIGTGTGDEPFIGKASLKVNIPNVKHFKIGEKLRVKIIYKIAHAAFSDIAIGHNPADTVAALGNRGAGSYLTTGNTRQTWLIPFRLY